MRPSGPSPKHDLIAEIRKTLFILPGGICNGAILYDFRNGLQGYPRFGCSNIDAFEMAGLCEKEAFSILLFLLYPRTSSLQEGQLSWQM